MNWWRTNDYVYIAYWYSQCNLTVPNNSKNLKPSFSKIIIDNVPEVSFSFQMNPLAFSFNLYILIILRFENISSWKYFTDLFLKYLVYFYSYKAINLKHISVRCMAKLHPHKCSQKNWFCVIRSDPMWNPLHNQIKKILSN